MSFNRCPFQLLRSYKRHEENKRKIGQERSSMQQTDYQCHRPTPWMQESVSMNARKCVHECKKVCPWMQESVSMDARKCVHGCKKVCPWMQESVSMHKSPNTLNHSRMIESSKVVGRGKRKDRKKERQPNQGLKKTWFKKINKPGFKKAWFLLFLFCFICFFSVFIENVNNYLFFSLYRTLVLFHSVCAT